MKDRPYGELFRYTPSPIFVFHEMKHWSRMDREQREKLERLEQVAHNTRTVIWQTEASGMFTYLNDVTTEVLGYRPEELVGQAFYYDLHPEEGREAFIESTQAAFEARESFRDFINPIVTRAGDVLHVATSGGPVVSPGGELLGYRGTDIDVTKRVRAELELAKRNDELERHRRIVLGLLEEAQRSRTALEQQAAATEAIFEAVPVGLLVIDDEFCVRRANSAALRLYGVSNVEEVVGQRCRDRLCASEAEECPLWHGDFDDQQNEYQLRRADGSEVTVLRTTLPIELDGEFVLLAALMEISQLKEIEKRLRDSNEELSFQTSRSLELMNRAKQASAAKSQFLANMSHEIRTPMTAILGFAESLQESALSESERREALDTILRNGQHLLQLINDILDLSKIEAGKLETEDVACSPLQLIEDVRSLMSVRAVAKGLRFELRVDGKLPKQIRSDPTRLRQILVNLVGNSIKFTELGHVTLHARYRRHADAARLEFAIEDTGIGISEEQLAGLFQAFQQADSSMSRRFGGTGLGLNISKRLAELLGGDIQAESVLGEGSLFCLSLDCPIYPDEELEAPQRGPTLSTSRKRSSSKSSKSTQAVQLAGRVLLAEDGPDNQRLIGHLVRKTGAELVIVDNGEKAVAATREATENGSPFDLVLMDMQMPVLDGYAATRELRLLGFETPISALTAHAMAGDRERCLDAGCSDYLTKPVDRKSLRGLLERYLTAQQATR